MAFGFIGKAFKGIKKVAKKIGKGIKKIGKKLLGAIGKIGPIGQLALMFIGIPPIISNFFSGLPGAIGGWVSKVAPNMAKAFNAIKTAGQGAYNTITQAIGNGVDRVMNFTKGKGFTLSGDRTSIFGGVSAKDIKVPDLTSNVKVDASGLPELVDGKLQFTDAPTTLGDRLTAAVEAGGTPQSLSEIAAQTTPPDSLLAPTIPDVSDITDATLSFGTEETTKKTLGERAKDYISEGIEGVTDTLSDPKKLAAETIKGGVISGGTTALARSIAGPPPTQKVMHSSLSDFMTATTQRPLDAATWNNVNNAYLKAGSSFGAAGDAMTPYFTELANFDNDINYQRQMAMLNPTLNPVR